jgi:triacylglycerol lipase
MKSQNRMANFWLTVERWASGMRAKIVNVGPLSIPYLEGGRGPDLLLIHGFGADGYNFTRVASYLRKRFHVIIPDLPGFGSATKSPTLAYDAKSQARYIAEFMNTIGVSSAHVGGSSMGGLIAAELALQYPQRVKSLWLLNALGCPAARNSEIFEDYKRTGKHALIIRSPEDFENCLKWVSAKRILLPQSLRSMYAARAIADAPLHEKISTSLTEETADLVAQKSTITQPTLIVWGMKDRVLSPECVPEQQQVFPNHQVILMKDIGHLPMIENARKSAHDFFTFFDSYVLNGVQHSGAASNLIH